MLSNNSSIAQHPHTNNNPYISNPYSKSLINWYRYQDDSLQEAIKDAKIKYLKSLVGKEASTSTDNQNQAQATETNSPTSPTSPISNGTGSGPGIGIGTETGVSVDSASVPPSPSLATTGFNGTNGVDGYDEKKEEEEPHFARLYAQMKGEYRDSLVIRQVSRSKSWKSTSWSGLVWSSLSLREGGVRAILSISLFLYCSIALYWWCLVSWGVVH